MVKGNAFVATREYRSPKSNQTQAVTVVYNFFLLSDVNQEVSVPLVACDRQPTDCSHRTKARHNRMEITIMYMQKNMVSILLAAGVLGALAVPATSNASTPVVVSIGVAPPALRYEAIPVARRGYVWVPGYWNWHRNRHVWVSGTWVRERRGYVYQPHRWEQRDGQWYMNRGRWDRDGDGIPDRRDRHPNNPYRP
jgi:hypothetical protein